MENELSVGIVLYNPNIKNLQKSIKELLKVTKNIYLVDNNSKNIEQIEKIFSKEVFLIKNNKNLGISKALNQLLDKSIEQKMKYLLTLDQDSIISFKAIKEMLNYTLQKDVALICPVIYDINKKNIKHQKEEVKEVDRCITSGTLMIIDKCKIVGKFDENMFIDYVDFDYCKRVKNNNMKIIKIKKAIIRHEIGKRSIKKFLFFNVYPTNHSPLRVYYYSRNIKYYLKKFNKQLTFKEKIKEYIYLIWKLVSIVLYEKNKKNKIHKFFLGLKDVRIMEGESNV